MSSLAKGYLCGRPNGISPIRVMVFMEFAGAKWASGSISHLSVDELPLDGYDAYLVSGASPQAFEIKRIGAILRKNNKRGILVGSPVVK